MGKRGISITSITIADKIRQALQRYNRTRGNERLTQKTLAKKINVPESTFSRWLSGERVPDENKLIQLAKILDAPELGQLTDHPANDYRIASLEAHNVQWIQSIPPHFTADQVQEMETGFDVFERFFVKNHSTGKILQYYRDRDVTFLYNTFKSVLRANCLQIVHVPRSTTHEEQLYEAFPNQLRQVIVADIPPKCDCSPIRAEFVAWLFAIHVLPTLARLKFIGLGYGYTLLRIPEIAVPHHQTFSGVNWIPLSAIHYDYSPSISETTVASKIPSANYITRRLQNKYPSSVGWYRRYYRDMEHMEQANLDDHTVLFNQIENLQSIVTSVNGYGRKSFEDTIPPRATQWRTSDYVALANMKDVYKVVKQKLDETDYQIGGEILGVFFDTRGEQILLVDSPDKENLNPEKGNFRIYLGKDFNSAFFQLDLRTLREVCKVSSVWVVASRAYKAAPIYYALKSGLINALVIDREIADEVLQMHSENL